VLLLLSQSFRIRKMASSNLDSTLTTITNVSGIAFSTFLGLHLVNHAAIHLGFETADNLRQTHLSPSFTFFPFTFVLTDLLFAIGKSSDSTTKRLPLSLFASLAPPRFT